MTEDLRDIGGRLARFSINILISTVITAVAVEIAGNLARSSDGRGRDWFLIATAAMVFVLSMMGVGVVLARYLKTAPRPARSNLPVARIFRDRARR